MSINQKIVETGNYLCIMLEMNTTSYRFTYRWLMRIVRRQVNIKEEDSIMIRSRRCTNNGSSDQISSFLIDAYIDSLCFKFDKISGDKQPKKCNVTIYSMIKWFLVDTSRYYAALSQKRIFFSRVELRYIQGLYLSPSPKCFPN